MRSVDTKRWRRTPSPFTPLLTYLAALVVVGSACGTSGSSNLSGPDSVLPSPDAGAESAPPEGPGASASPSPFGVCLGTDPPTYEKSLIEATKLNIGWARLTGPTGFVWEMIEREPGAYDWQILDDNVRRAHDAGLSVLVTVLVVNKAYGVEHGFKPTDMEPYLEILAAAAERYDGDGEDDAPGSPVVSVWQIANEVDGMDWKDSHANYAALLDASITTIKSVDPAAKVAIAGMIGPVPMAGDDGFGDYQQIVDHLSKDNFFDILDLHWHAAGGGNYQEQASHGLTFDEYLAKAKQLLSGTSAAIWITETSISDVVPAGQTEARQAADLFKRYVYPAVNGVEVVFWNGIYDLCWIVDGEDECGHYFSNTSLIDTDGNKKLAYYTYQLSATTFAGVDWTGAETIRSESGGAHLYRVEGEEGALWIAWDDRGAGEVSLSALGLAAARVTEVVPRSSAGAEIDERAPLASYAASGAVELGESPVIIRAE